MRKDEMAEISARLDNIESILKMLLVNSVLDDAETERIKEDALEKLREILEAAGFVDARLNCIENKYYAFATIRSDNSLATIKRIYPAALKILEPIPLVLVFKQLHPKRRKSLEEARISYYIDAENAELRIFSS